jgi:hypothetical protein
VVLVFVVDVTLEHFFLRTAQSRQHSGVSNDAIRLRHGDAENGNVTICTLVRSRSGGGGRRLSVRWCRRSGQMEGPPVAPPAEALLASHYNSRGTYQTAAVREQYLPVGSARSLENHARLVCSSFIRDAVEAGGSREDGRAAYRAAVARSLSAVVAAPDRTR